MKLNTGVRNSQLIRILLLLMATGAWFALTAHHALAAEPETCSTNSETRQLDYWIGDWSLKSAGAPGGISSKVSLSLDKCLFTESWDNGQGHTGEEMFAYSPDDKSWHGMFADNQGRVHIFVDGKVAAGSAEFYGPNRGPHGEEILNRIKLVRVAADKLEKTWEKSTDKGVTWTKVFSGEYSRRNH